MVDCKENYKFDLGIKGLILRNKLQYFRAVDVHGKWKKYVLLIN